MKILAVDIGTGTQDIFLFDSRLAVENGFKFVLPSPTMMIRHKIQAATRRKQPILLTGVTMGGGPNAWAAEDHLRAGLPLFATPEAAATFNDDLDAVREMGVQVISQDEAFRLSEQVVRLTLQDFDFNLLRSTFEAYGVSLNDLAAAAVAVFDHGAAPPEISDRKFRFDYLNDRIRAHNRLSAFAYLAGEVPAPLTRLQSVVTSAQNLDVPLIVMDTAPAAVLGATFDPLVRRRLRVLICNVGNFHTLAFRLGENGIEGVFEHHTGFLDQPALEKLLISLADGSLTNADVFDSMGHGALINTSLPLPFDHPAFNVVVTGPRRAMLHESKLGIYNAVPFGDMMITGCFGLLAAAADLLPALHDEISASLRPQHNSAAAPWDAEPS